MNQGLGSGLLGFCGPSRVRILSSRLDGQSKGWELLQKSPGYRAAELGHWAPRARTGGVASPAGFSVSRPPPFDELSFPSRGMLSWASCPFPSLGSALTRTPCDEVPPAISRGKVRPLRDSALAWPRSGPCFSPLSRTLPAPRHLHRTRWRGGPPAPHPRRLLSGLARTSQGGQVECPV